MFECPICYQRRRKVVNLQCNHAICHFCWEKWSNREVQFYGKAWPTCPTCREPQKPWYLKEDNQRLIVFVSFVILVWLRLHREEPDSPSFD